MRPAGGLRPVLQEVAERRARLRRDGGHHATGDRGRQLLHHVGGHVVRDAAEDVGDALQRQPDEQVVAVVRLQVDERGRQLRRFAAVQHQVAHIGVDARQRIGELCGVQPVHEGQRAIEVVALQERDDLGRGLGRRTVRSGALVCHAAIVTRG